VTTATPGLALVALVLGVAACRTEQTLVTPDPHLERMLDQPKAMAYGEAPLLPNDATMQSPPDGTLAVDALLGPSALVTGADPAGHAAGTPAEGYVDRIPLAVDRALLETGRARFEVFCAACHGVLGDGASAVAPQMALRKPPSLVDPPKSTDPPGEMFNTIRKGYGLMPSYAVQLSVNDAWAVVAYLRALRLARRARVSELPPELRERLAQEAP
jgi:mono/diheme cytochrome c family protein